MIDFGPSVFDFLPLDRRVLVRSVAALYKEGVPAQQFAPRII